MQSLYFRRRILLMAYLQEKGHGLGVSVFLYCKAEHFTESHTYRQVEEGNQMQRRMEHVVGNLG